MQSINISDVKTFMKRLLIDNSFDDFLLEDASITTFNTFNIDGHLQKAYYSKEEYEALNLRSLSYWHEIKPICFELIKGKKTPLGFTFILQLDSFQIKSFYEKCNLEESKEFISNFFLNIKYENSTLDCITAISYKQFTLDKTIEKEYDKYIEKFLLALI